jgi:hypothetical protein
MSGKTGLLIGLMVGLVIASGAVVATMLVTGSTIKERESTAWQAGYDTRAEHALGEQRTITTTLNQGLIDENEKLSRQSEQAGAKLTELLARVDLGADARKLAGEAAKDLGVEVQEAPPTPAAKPYDDSLGKLETPDATWKVTHILVSWDGLGVPTKKPRKKDEARKLIDEIWAKYSEDPTVAHWKALQVQYNEDNQAHTVYDNSQPLIEPFKTTAKSTKVGFARIVESQFGFHLIRRES